MTNLAAAPQTSTIAPVSADTGLARSFTVSSRAPSRIPVTGLRGSAPKAVKPRLTHGDLRQKSGSGNPISRRGVYHRDCGWARNGGTGTVEGRRRKANRRQPQYYPSCGRERGEDLPKAQQQWGQTRVPVGTGISQEGQRRMAWQLRPMIEPVARKEYYHAGQD